MGRLNFGVTPLEPRCPVIRFGSSSEETPMNDSPSQTIPPVAHHRRTRATHRTLPRLAVLALVGMALTLAACSSGGSATSSSSTAGSSGSTATTGGTGGSSSGTDAITIKNFAFSPASITVAPGATVTVTNKDQVTHTLTASDGRFDTGDISSGASKTFTAPKTAGKYPYICSIHQYMAGTVTVS
jgi:plastocyanin